MDGMSDEMQQVVDQVIAILTTYGLSVVAAIVILIIGWTIAGMVKNSIIKAGSKSDKMDPTLTRFFAAIARYTIIAFTVIAVLGRFGVETTSLVAILGAAGLAIGLALQGTLSNLAAGVMLIFFRPFKINDFVEAGGTSGTVKEISLFTTEMATPDNVKVIVPNSQIWGGTIKNFSGNETRRVDFVFGISYEDDINQAIGVIENLIAADSRAHQDPAPQLVVGELADSSVNIIVRVWAAAGDYWGIKFDLTKAVKEAFDQKQISIPYPQQVVHHIHEAESSDS